MIVKEIYVCHSGQKTNDDGEVEGRSERAALCVHRP